MSPRDRCAQSALREASLSDSPGRSAAEAYRILEHHRVDVVVSDERMPGESGTEFLANVRGRYPNTIRIILSGQASLEAAVPPSTKASCTGFFLSPAIRRI
jgi:two-component system, probable response regulator PhcQ